MDFKIVLSMPALLGVVTGLRTMTGLAVIGFTAYFGWIDLKESPRRFSSSPLAVILLLLGALGEYIADKLPRTGKRIAPGTAAGAYDCWRLLRRSHLFCFRSVVALWGACPELWARWWAVLLDTMPAPPWYERCVPPIFWWRFQKICWPSVWR